MSGGYGRAHGAEIARAPSPQSEPRQRAGKVGCCLQLLAQGLAEPGLIGEIGDGVEPRIQHLDVGQRTAETARKLARPGRRHRAIDRGEQAASTRALVRADQLEIGARRRVDDEQAASALFPRRAKQRRTSDLGDLDISEEARKRGKLGAAELAERVERGDAKPLLQSALASERIEMGARAWRQRGARLSDPFANFGSPAMSSPTSTSPGFSRASSPGRSLALTEAAISSPVEMSREASASICSPPSCCGGAEQRGQEIMRARVEQAFLGKRPRRDEADDVTANHRLRPALPRLGGVLELLAHSDAMTLGDETLEIVVSRAHRHAAHRNVLALMLAALGERDAERARGDLGVLEEQLVEIAHAVEQEAIGVRRLDLEILGDHWRGAGSVFSARGA